MRILYHHRTRATDAQRVHILEIVKAFRSLGHEVTIASLVDTESPETESPRVENGPQKKSLLRRIPFLPEFIQLSYNAWAIPWLVWRILVYKPAFIYERYSLFNFAGVIAARICRRHIVLEVNSPLALEQTREGEIRATRLAWWSERFICNNAGSVLVVTGPLKKILLENGVVPDKVTVMTNGVNAAHFCNVSEAASLCENLNLTGKVVFGFVGWFRPWHGLDLLVDAFAETGLSELNCVLLLVGDGPATPALKEQVTRLGLNRSVLFTGSVTHANVPVYLQQFHVAVQPAANEYCCPMKILEYMELALPIVAPRQENILELLTDGEQARLFKPGDRAELARALWELANDAGVRREMGRRGKEIIRERGYFWIENARRVVDMVEAGKPSESRSDSGSVPVLAEKMVKRTSSGR